MTDKECGAKCQRLQLHQTDRRRLKNLLTTRRCQLKIEYLWSNTLSASTSRIANCRINSCSQNQFMFTESFHVHRINSLQNSMHVQLQTGMTLYLYVYLYLSDIYIDLLLIIYLQIIIISINYSACILRFVKQGMVC